jgi:hypothetical protein
LKSAVLALLAIASALLPIGAIAQTPAIPPPVLTQELKVRPILKPVVLTTIPVVFDARSVDVNEIGKMDGNVLVIDPADIKGRRLILPTVKGNIEGKARKIDICIGRWRKGECSGIYIGSRAD